MARPRIDPEHPDSPARAIAVAMATLLRRRGYHGAGLNEVVAGSGAPRGSVYHHYPQGKDASFEDFEAFMHRHGTEETGLEGVLAWAQDLHGPGALDDDFSIVRIRF